MWNRFVVWLTNFSLAKSNLTLEQRNRIISQIMSNLQALPIHGIISTNEDGEILIGGRSLEIDKLRQIREAAIVALDNKALSIVDQEVLYAAVVGGLHKATKPEDLYFFRAAIWVMQQREFQLRTLAQRTE